MEEYVLHFKDIDPLAKFKHWSTLSVENMVHIEEKASNPKPVEAVFIASDPVDWGRDIQVCFESAFIFATFLYIVSKFLSIFLSFKNSV